MSDKLKTLSAAIRLGATFRPQVRGAMYQLLPRSNCGHHQLGSCALGAAAEAIGFTPVADSDAIPDKPEGQSDPFFVLRRFDESLNAFIEHSKFPFDESWRGASRQVQAIIVYLNDALGWSREKIANWLETQGF